MRVQFHIFLALISSSIGFVANSVYANTPEAAAPAQCEVRFAALHGQRDPNDPDFLSDSDLIREKQRLSQFGRVTSEYDSTFKTRVYYPATAKPRPDGTIPRTDPEARALFIYFHGSGTMKASGGTFAYKQNKLAEMGYTSLGFDFPFHKDGPTDPEMAKSDVFMKWLHGLIEAHKNPGQPVYLVGHSFGPDLIAEYLKRYPMGVDGAVLLSPAGFTHELNEWYEKHTTKMQEFWTETESNDAGAKWAGEVTEGFTWSKPVTDQSPDPTVVNPKLKVRVLSGDREEYVPGPLDEKGLPTQEPRTYDFCAALRRFMKNIVCTIEPGVGHMIFAHQDAKGQDVILREVLAVNGDSLDQAKELKAAASARTLTDAQQVAQRYAREALFRTWVKVKYGADKIKELLASGDAKTAQTLGRDFKITMAKRDEALAKNIAKTKEWAPEFYNAHHEDIDALPKNLDRISSDYVKYLETLTPEQRAAHAMATEEVYALPERTNQNPHHHHPQTQKP